MANPKVYWPSWRYGPNGEAEIFKTADDVPEGWFDHPSKHAVVKYAPPATPAPPAPPSTPATLTIALSCCANSVTGRCCAAAIGTGTFHG